MEQDDLNRASKALTDKAREVLPLATPDAQMPDCLAIFGDPHTGCMGLSFDSTVNGSTPVETRMALAALWMRKAIVSMLQNPKVAEVYSQQIARTEVARRSELDPGKVN